MSSVCLAGPAGGDQGAEVVTCYRLNYSLFPSREDLAVIGLSGRAWIKKEKMEKARDKGARSLTTTIGVKKTTKARLDKNKAPGQSYNGFIGQLIDLWEEVKEGRLK